MDDQCDYCPANTEGVAFIPVGMEGGSPVVRGWCGSCDEGTGVPIDAEALSVLIDWGVLAVVTT